MADDTYSRGYRNDHHDRGGASDSAPDPLTELARLIGQSDPFAPDRRRQGQQPAQYPQSYDTGAHDDRYGGAGEPQHYAAARYDQAEGHAVDHNGYAYPQATQHEAGYGDTSGYGERQPYHQEQHALHSDPQAYQQDPHAYQQDEQAYHQDPHAYHQDPNAYHQDQPAYAPSEPAYVGHATTAPEPGEPADQVDPAALHPDQHGGYPAPPFYGDPSYDDAPAPRRGWLVTAAALVGLAVVGTAGAFAYRAVFTGGETRIITRDVGPSKITPAQTSQDNANKPSDRLASAGQNERLGPPPEQPIAIPEPPRTVPPALGQGQPPPAPVMPIPPSAAGTPAEPAGPPARVVRTERIKPADQPGDATTARPPARANASPPAQPPQQRVATQTPPPPSNAPLSLAPQGIPSPTAPALAPAPPSHTTAAASPGPAVERSAAGGSGYYVQVSAQKSEEEAKSSFRGIQARHGSLLGGQQVVVRRKDLGSKGIFYGAQVGPFSRDAAAKLCKDLEAAGQSCMVQRN